MKIWQIAIVVFAIWISSASKINAEGILFQDNFEQESLNNWRAERNQQWSDLSKPCLNNNAPAEWQIKNGQLGIVLDGPNCVFTIVPRLLDLSAIKNYQYDFDLTLNETAFADRGFVFNWQNSQNWYGFKFFNGTVILDNSLSNQYRVIENSFRYPFYPNATYHLTIIVTNNSVITLKINNLIQFEIDDAPYSISGFKTIGLEASNGTVSRSVTFYDNIVVRSLDPGIHLDIPLIKQIDPQWMSEEYDSAKKWAQQPTIGRWGCSLTSMVMILRYYGLNFLPDGTYLNPITLNTWLKSQVDGYIGEGNLNWLAITRLTREINSRFGTPKLEFKRTSGSIELAKEQIKLQRPVIVKIDGHFLVADGVTEDDHDLLVKDPAFTYSQFSQYQTDPLAIETFTPSFTDLSYFLMTHDDHLQVHLLNEKGSQLAEFEETEEHLQEFDSQRIDKGQQRASTLFEHLISKPKEGSYVLQVSSSSVGFYPFHFFIYDLLGNATDLSQSTYYNAEPKYFLISYVKDKPPSIQLISSFGSFRQDLLIGKNLNQIYSDSVWSALDKEAEFAELSGTTRQLRYLKMIKILVDQFSENLASSLYLTLKKDLSDLSEQLNVIISR